MTNPDMMSGMMKQNLVGIIPQVSVPFTERLSDHCQFCSHRQCSQAFLVPCTDRHGRLCELFLLWLHPGEDSLPTESILQAHAAGQAPWYPTLT